MEFVFAIDKGGMLASRQSLRVKPGDGMGWNAVTDLLNGHWTDAAPKVHFRVRVRNHFGGK
jgi:hypothetical protein